MKQLMEYLVELELAVPIEQPEPGYWMVGLLGDRDRANTWHPTAPRQAAVLGRRVQFSKARRGQDARAGAWCFLPVGVFPRLHTLLFQVLSSLGGPTGTKPTFHMDACQLLAVGVCWPTAAGARTPPQRVFVRQHPRHSAALDVVVEGSKEHAAQLMHFLLHLVVSTCQRLCPADKQVDAPLLLCPRCLRGDQLDHSKCSWHATEEELDMSAHHLHTAVQRVHPIGKLNVWRYKDAHTVACGQTNFSATELNTGVTDLSCGGPDAAHGE